MNLNRQSELTWPFQRGGVCVAPVMLLASLGVYLAVSVKAQSPARDPDYNPGFAGAVQSQAVQPDGKILLAGSFTKLGDDSTPRIRVASGSGRKHYATPG
jgi:hypothetical protein